MSVETMLQKIWSVEHFAREKLTLILLSGKLRLPLENGFNDYFIDKVDKIMRIFKNCHNSEDIFFDSRFLFKDHVFISTCHY